MLFFEKIFKIIIFIGIFLLTLEIFLQIGSFVISFKYKAKYQLASKEKSLRIMFIGDSWTQGADATPKHGYVDLTSQALKKLFPDKDIQVYNVASFNSYLKKYKREELLSADGHYTALGYKLLAQDILSILMRHHYLP